VASLLAGSAAHVLILGFICLAVLTVLLVVMVRSRASVRAPRDVIDGRSLESEKVADRRNVAVRDAIRTSQQGSSRRSGS
jgi:uncharacterized membrane protein